MNQLNILRGMLLVMTVAMLVQAYNAKEQHKVAQGAIAGEARLMHSLDDAVRMLAEDETEARKCTK